MEVLPKETFYNKINTIDAELQTKVSFAKQRWNEKRDENNVENKVIFNRNTGVIDLSNKKAT